jgi:hypothetical protein
LGGWAKQIHSIRLFLGIQKLHTLFGSSPGTVLELPPHAYVNFLIA